MCETGSCEYVSLYLPPFLRDVLMVLGVCGRREAAGLLFVVVVTQTTAGPVGISEFPAVHLIKNEI